ncbi:MAG TPA: hypothetical protein VGO07_01425 [Candidatus Saccharimonadales bacterium]|nr:hypothetical protein [Candidatus Saccharimonadales bacterium]
MNKLQRESGFSIVGLALAVVIVAVIGFIGWKVYQGVTDRSLSHTKTPEAA